MKLFVCGTDTGVGKTFVSTALCLKYNLTYYKPIQSGYREKLAIAQPLPFQDLETLTDRQFVESFEVTSSSPELYLLKQPLSPNQSAQIENVEIDIDKLRITLMDSKHQIIEGCGGLMVPLTSKVLLIDVLAILRIPVLLVARSGLGTLNHTLLSVEALKMRQIPLAGVLLNGPRHHLNEDTLRQFHVPLVGCLNPIDQLQKSNFTNSLHIERQFNEQLDQ